MVEYFQIGGPYFAHIFGGILDQLLRVISVQVIMLQPILTNSDVVFPLL